MLDKLWVATAVLFVICCTSTSFGFEENVTHGYVNCMTCHYNPTGGNLLNEYGRSLSSELMSTWSHPGSEKAFGGLIPETKWAKFGGDLRTLQSYLDTPAVQDRSLFLMQNNVEIGLVYSDKVMVVGSLGTSEGPDGFPGQGKFLSERHYVLLSPTQTSRVKIGKFRTNYGLVDPNHNRITKRGLGFGFFSEQYSAEYSKFMEFGEVFFNYSVGRIDRTRRPTDERSFSTKFSYYATDKAKLSVHALYGETEIANRHLAGVSGTAAVTEKTYVMYEVDYENKQDAANGVNNESILSHLRYGYEAFKGFKGYALYDYQNVIGAAQRFTAPGLGLQWLPYPHFELQAEYQAGRFEGQEVSHFGFVMFHVYY
jgi:hypothetical protein